jgi:hypothetical protein
MARGADVPPRVLERLASRGLSADQPLRALDALEPGWGTDGELEAAVAALLGASNDADAGPRLARLAVRTTDKHVKREIKRALYKLEQRGLWHAPEAPPPPAARDLLGPSEDEPEAWLSAIDPSGSRLIWMARRSGSGMASLSALVSETKGLQEFYAGGTTRKALRQAQRDLSVRNGIQLVEAPWAHADALLVRAVSLGAEPGQAAEVARVRREVVPHPPASQPRPPVDALVDRASAAQDDQALALSASALGERELAGWLLPREWVDDALPAIEEAQGSLVIVSPQQREERSRTALERAVEDALAAPERRELFAARLEETAYLLARRGQIDLARALVAATDATRAGRKIVDVPVLAQIAARSFGLAFELRAEKARDESRSSLIVTPQQALAEQRRLATRRGR